MGRIGPLLAALAVPALALAEPSAKSLVKQAIAKSHAGAYEAAIDLYKQAYDLAPNPILLSNIGTEYEHAEKPRQALKYFCKYLDADPTGPNAHYARTQIKAIAGDLDLSDEDACEHVEPDVKPQPAPAAETPVAPQPPPPTEPERHANTALEYTGAAIGVAGVVGLALGIHYGLDAAHLSDAINSHDASQPWPTTIDGVPIDQTSAQGAAWNRDTYICTIIGGLAVAAGVAMVLVGHHGSATDTAPRVSIVPTGAGLAAFGRF